VTASWLADPAAYAHIGPADFVHALFGDALTPERRCVVWSKSASCTWCTTTEQVSAAATSLDATTDVYFGVCLQDPAAERPGSRGSAESAVVVPGVWADLDVAGPGKKKVHAPSVEALLAHLAQRIEQRPSIVLLTGGGLHAWWLFDEPLVLTDEAERRGAAELVHRWQARLRAVLEEKGWALDSTHDLARVMRLPGTRNHKPEHEPPFQIRVVAWEVD
jgi:hypothetical protein